MKRFAFKMFLKPGFEEEYAKRHAAIWPELEKQIKASGIRNYSIFLDRETNILFGYQEVEGTSNSQDAEAADEITHRWWDAMADIMEVNPDNSPVTVPVTEVFHLD
ncbi:MAG: L-rhamnose mutarotase [Bacteroidales bacterium]|nr:L-rhamnose mutarotase [Bacteroidales bacterium]MCM1146622.1 L-rhamnose mutarotase [Bacteroidales bacterium]MCM1206014.1 L-rhamnose mutarotase [Bacillota bacterium]MCM1511492.1 L-rhamnose mutarotase [Clostridium sp.]